VDLEAKVVKEVRFETFILKQNFKVAKIYKAKVAMEEMVEMVVKEVSF
jgi:hypothetical protein